MATAENFPRLLTTEETGALLNISPGTLTIWRCTNAFPLAYVKIGRSVRYLETDILRFIRQRRKNPNKLKLSRGGIRASGAQIGK